MEFVSGSGVYEIRSNGGPEPVRGLRRRPGHNPNSNP